MRYLIVAMIVGSVAVLASAQSKTITNADLEKFRQKRLAAEKDLRENYRELGFGSPEERARDIERSQRELSEQAARLRSERRARQQSSAARSDQGSTVYFYRENTPQYRYYPGVILGSQSRFGKRYFPRRGYRNTRRIERRGPGYISNPYIRQTWRRQSQSMRQTYRSNRVVRSRRN